jgi:hypothetical protein
MPQALNRRAQDWIRDEVASIEASSKIDTWGGKVGKRQLEERDGGLSQIGAGWVDAWPKIETTNVTRDVGVVRIVHDRTEAEPDKPVPRRKENSIPSINRHPGRSGEMQFS